MWRAREKQLELEGEIQHREEEKVPQTQALTARSQTLIPKS
jgi:hypothetical protein